MTHWTARREFLSRAVTLAGLPALLSASKAVAQSVTAAHPIALAVDSSQALTPIPANFMGLGYEISSVATPGLLSAANSAYVQFVRTLSPRGVIRVGGNTSDYSLYSSTGDSKTDPKGTVVTKRNLVDLGTFLRATGWDLIWGLNLGNGTELDAVNEAKTVAAIANDRLLAFEIGNEPDLFGRGTAHRLRNYEYADYLREYRRYKNAIRRELPDAPFAGPDAAVATDWVTAFAADEAKDLKLLTHHYYRECAGATSTLDKLLHPDPKLQPTLDKLKAASAGTHVPYRICETNSFCGGGKPGVSDTFGAALWVLDFLFKLAAANAGGVNMETGINQLGFVSSYSPIGDDEHGSYSAKPEYYGMLAFARASTGRLVHANYDAGELNFTAYAVTDAGRVAVTLINKDFSSAAAVSISADRSFSEASVLRLTGPSPASKEGVRFGGSQADTRGNWQPTKGESAAIENRRCHVRVPAASAAVVTLS